MKVILLFALFYLSFYQANGHEGVNGTSDEGGREIGNEGGNKDYPIPPKPDSKEHTYKTSKISYGNSKDCLARALRKSSVFMKKTGVILCEYKTFKESGETNSFEEAKSFMHSVGRLGCELEGMLGKGRSMEDVLTKISVSKDQLSELLEKILSALNISDMAAGSICSLVGRAFQSKCMQDALPKASPETVQRMRRLYCQVKTDDTEIARNLAVMLSDTGCPVTNLAETSRTMEDLTGSLGDAIKPVVGNALDLTKKLPVHSDLICNSHKYLEKGGIMDRILKGQ